MWKITVDADQGFQDFFSWFTPEQAEIVANVGAQTAVTSLKERVFAGKGVKDKPMRYKGKIYSKEWAKIRREGRKKTKTQPAIPGGKTTDKRDLTMTGQMLAAVHAKDAIRTATGATAIVTVGGDGHVKKKALNNQFLTPWFGISPDDEELTAGVMRDTMDELLGRRENK